jgi:uncharacterized membrane protein
MATLTSIYLFSHVAAGMITLIAGPIAIFANRKYTKLHKIAGKTFFYAMLFVCFSSIIGFFRHYNIVFYQFLLGIALLVLAGILRGVRALQIMKTGVVKPFDFGYTILLGITTIGMLGMGAWHFTQGTMIAFPILFTVFGLGCLSDTTTNYKMFSNPLKFEKIEWLKLHVQTMIGCLMASTTAFTVNTAHFLPWYIQWFGPTILLLPLQFYWGKKLIPVKDKTKEQAI